MNGTPSALVMSFRRPAVSIAICSDSITQGPAIKNSGRSSPTSKPASFMLPPRAARGPPEGDVARLGAALRLPVLPPRAARGHAEGDASAAWDGPAPRSRGGLLSNGRDFHIAVRLRSRLLTRQCGLDKRLEQRMSMTRRRCELGVKLNADEKRMRRQLHDLGQLLAGRSRGNRVPAGFELRHIDVVDLVAVPMAFVHFGAVNARRQCAALDRTLLRPEPHRAAEIGLRIAALDTAGAIGPFSNQRN